MKKQHFNLLLILCFSISLISSCTIQKRTVNKGYFVQWHWDKKIKSEKAESEELSSTNLDETETEEITTVERNLETKENSFERSSDSDFKPTFDLNIENIRIKTREIKSTFPATECFTKGKHLPLKILKSFKKAKPAAMDGELIVNILLTILFLALAIIFTLLAIKVGAGLMMYIWGILALVAFIIFVTQVIDIIMW